MVNTPLIAGNWKMNGTWQGAAVLAGELAGRAAGGDAGCEILICPPAPLLYPVAAVLDGSPVRLGGQDCHPQEAGAHTGDISAAMLADAGCSHVIVGHSERRADHGEGDGLVRAKAEAAHRAGLVAIICLGETLDQRDDGRAAEIVGAQLAASLPEGAGPKNTVIAYEPVWAIGTGRTPETGEVAEIHALIRARLRAGLKAGDRVLILYGGSVKPDNARELLSLADVDGALVGGASLDVDDFWAICLACP